jgi:two-component system chemotaxis response regulator CheB
MSSAAATASRNAVRVMVVDDSAVVRGFIVRMLESDSRIAVVATCSNGQIAVQQAAKLALDVIVLDIEMPVMDGITALPKLIAANPHARIVMASTLTQRNATISLEALARGATDYIAKPTSDKLSSSDDFRRTLIEKVVGLGAIKSKHAAAAVAPKATAATVSKPAPALRRAGTSRPKIIAIGSSTGGPLALMSVLSALPRETNCPIVIAQHMPATFTAVLAQHLGRASGRPCSEAANNVEIRPGHIYLAPGDYHFELVASGGGVVARLSQTPPENFCRPSVDPLFRSVARLYGAEACGVILTGMGSDGCSGARALAAAGAPIVAQDEATSVVWGMPGAVAHAGVCSAILPLGDIAGHIAKLCDGGTR